MLEEVKLKKYREKDKNRYRNKILNFRISEDEKLKIEKRIELSGLNKQDYFIQSCINQKVICYGNVKTFEKIKEDLIEIKQTLSIRGDLNEVQLESLKMILQLYDNLNLEIND